MNAIVTPTDYLVEVWLSATQSSVQTNRLTHVPEKKLDFPRQWVEFIDPLDDTNLYRCDLTWLTSRWTCIWGNGCKGISAENPDVGCCTFGAHFSDKEDIKNTKKYVKLLTPEVWQNYKEGRKNGYIEVDEDGDKKTRAYEGACIFHNRNGFEGGDGCALHILALQLGVNPLVTKPQVCWELPIRRSFENVTRPDDIEITVITISEYNRRGWGAGGVDLDWYCTTATEAHVAAKPVYKSYEPELVELMGRKAYDILAEFCAAREVALQAARSTGDKRVLKSFAVHPADPS